MSRSRPTVYKGIKMRSRLEAGFAAFLDSRSLVWEYEPSAFANEHGQYLPDFVVHDVVWYSHPTPGAPWPSECIKVEWPLFIDTKPNDEHNEATLERMAIVWDSTPNALLVVQSPQYAEPIGRELPRLAGSWWACRRCPAVQFIVFDWIYDDVMPSIDTWMPGCQRCDSPRPLVGMSPWAEKYWSAPAAMA